MSPTVSISAHSKHLLIAMTNTKQNYYRYSTILTSTLRQIHNSTSSHRISSFVLFPTGSGNAGLAIKGRNLFERLWLASRWSVEDNPSSSWWRSNTMTMMMMIMIMITSNIIVFIAKAVDWTYLFDNSFKVVTEVDRFIGIMRRQKVPQVFYDDVCVVICLSVNKQHQ